MTTSKIWHICWRNSSTPGRFKTNISHILPSISMGNTISVLGMYLKEEWTRVSSRSKIRVFFPTSRGFYGPKYPPLGEIVS